MSTYFLMVLSDSGLLTFKTEPPCIHTLFNFHTERNTKHIMLLFLTLKLIIHNVQFNVSVHCERCITQTKMRKLHERVNDTLK